jgi:mannan polymerase II complex MNN10 subunit
MPSYPNGGSHNVTWASAQAKSAEVKGYSFNPRNQGFFGRHFRRLSTSLPFSYADKEKLGRGRYQSNKAMELVRRIGRSLWKLRRSLGLVLLLILSFILFYVTRKSPHLILRSEN